MWQTALKVVRIGGVLAFFAALYIAWNVHLPKIYCTESDMQEAEQVVSRATVGEPITLSPTQPGTVQKYKVFPNQKKRADAVWNACAEIAKLHADELGISAEERIFPWHQRLLVRRLFWAGVGLLFLLFAIFGGRLEKHLAKFPRRTLIPLAKEETREEERDRRITFLKRKAEKLDSELGYGPIVSDHIADLIDRDALDTAETFVGTVRNRIGELTTGSPHLRGQVARFIGLDRLDDAAALIKAETRQAALRAEVERRRQQAAQVKTERLQLIAEQWRELERLQREFSELASKDLEKLKQLHALTAQSVDKKVRDFKKALYELKRAIEDQREELTTKREEQAAALRQTG